MDGEKQPRLVRAHADEHKQEEEQRYHRNEELPAQTSFVTSASLPRVLLQPLSCGGGGGAFGRAGVHLLRAASWCHLGELILNSDNGQKSFGEGVRVVSQVPARNRASELGLGHQEMEKACGRPTDKHLFRRWMCTAGAESFKFLPCYQKGLPLDRCQPII